MAADIPQTPVARFNQGMGARYILFDETSTSTLSKVFAVGFNQGLIISGYGFAQSARPPSGGPGELQRATVQKVCGPIQKMPFEEWFCGPGDRQIKLLDFEIVQQEDVTQCGTWCLNACQNLVLLTVPGAYRLELSDPEMLRNVYVELISIDRETLDVIPRDLFLGQLS